MRATSKIAVVIVAGLLCSPVGAQELPPSLTTPRAMNLADAISYAKAHQPAVLLGIVRVAARREATNIPRSQWLPSFGASAQAFGATANNSSALYLTQDEVDIPRIGGTASNTSNWQPQGSTFAAIGVRQEVFDFGRIAAETAAADEMVEVEKQASANALLDVTYGVE
jgi:outer membrane protein TolC